MTVTAVFLVVGRVVGNVFGAVPWTDAMVFDAVAVVFWVVTRNH